MTELGSEPRSRGVAEAGAERKGRKRRDGAKMMKTGAAGASRSCAGLAMRPQEWGRGKHECLRHIGRQVSRQWFKRVLEGPAAGQRWG